jgi:hypothetical protein
MFFSHSRLNIQLLLIFIRRKQKVAHVFKRVVLLVFTYIRIEIGRRIVSCDACEHLFIFVDAVVCLALVVDRNSALLVLRGNFSVVPSLDLLVDKLIDSIELVKH